MKTIILFGGVFDPVHIGHLSIYETIKKHYKFDKFIIVPSKNPPLKSHQPYAFVWDRLMMLNLMFRKYRDIEISDYEIKQKHENISYTIDTLKYFHKKYPHTKFYFVVGTDRYLDFKKWKDWQKILKLANLIVVKRNNQKINKSIPADFIDIKFIPTSSSELRTLPQVNYLTPLVAQYIAIYGVYIINQVKPLMSIERFHHTIRVTQLAIEIGKTISTKLAFSAYIACMYHDIAKEMSDQKVKKLVGNWDKKRFPTIHTLHGLASARYAKKYFNISDSKILNAVANHVIPSNKPTLLDMLVYCADKLEPNRTKEDVSNRIGYIKLAKTNLKKAFSKLYKETSNHYNN